MRLFRRRRRVDLGKYRAPLEWPEPTVEETVEEAMLIAGSAVRLALKNLVIVRALQERADYSVEHLLGATREEFLNLADEKEADARRVDAQHDYAAEHGGNATHQSDYRMVDAPTLARRVSVLKLLAKRLREVALDEAYATRLIEEARDDALDDVLGAFARTQTASGPPSDDVTRAQRRAMVALDLQDLAESRRGNSRRKAGDD
jgi:hypothetical protein